MCVCVYMCVCHVFVFICVCVHVCVCMWICVVCAFMCMHVYMYVCIFVLCVCVCIYVCVCMWVVMLITTDFVQIKQWCRLPRIDSTFISYMVLHERWFSLYLCEIGSNVRIFEHRKAFLVCFLKRSDPKQLGRKRLGLYFQVTVHHWGKAWQEIKQGLKQKPWKDPVY